MTIIRLKIRETYHPVVAQIISLLEEHYYWFETFEHEPVRTSQEAAKIRSGYSLEQGAKALIIRLKYSKNESKFVMLVLPGDARFDKQKVAEAFKTKDIRFATEAEVGEITSGVELGGVPPFGNLFGLDVIVDPSLLEHEKIIFNAGDRRFSIAMKTDDYVTLVQPKIVRIIL
jgi:Ala-tRNA(Pro) deacylase